VDQKDLKKDKVKAAVDLNGEKRTNQRLSSKLRSRRSSSRSLQRSNESRGGLVKEEAKAETKVS